MLHQGLLADGSPSSIGGGLSIDGSPITGLTGTVVGYENGYETGGHDVHLNSAINSSITTYHPNDRIPGDLDVGNNTNSINKLGFNCPSSMDIWPVQAYCE